jgi:hypothetical protein
LTFLFCFDTNLPVIIGSDSRETTMKMAIAIIIFFGVSLFYCPLMADVVVDFGMPGGWQTWVDPNGMIQPYWDGTSWDPGGPINIGYYLKGNFGAGPGWQFWARNAVGVRDKDFRFQTTGLPQVAYLLLEVAGFAEENELYWYNSLNPNNKGLIFSGSDAPPTQKTFTPTPSWGFAIYTPQDKWFYTESVIGNDSGAQHFSIFRNSLQPEVYWIGIEDLKYSASDKDFQDMVFKLMPIPIPSTFILLGAGLIGFAALRKKIKMA